MDQVIGSCQAKLRIAMDRAVRVRALAALIVVCGVSQIKGITNLH